MLGKLTKYEFRACFRYALPFYVAVLAAAVLLRFVMPGYNAMNNMSTIAYAISGTLYGGLIVAVLVMTFVIQLRRFYKNLLGDEGYLMFSLPVTPGQHIKSKAIVALLLDIFAVFIIAASILIVATIENIPESVRSLFETLEMNGINCAELVLLVILKFVSSMLFAYMCISIGHLANRNRVAITIAAYFVLRVIISLISRFVDSIYTKTALYDWYLSLSSSGRWHFSLLGSCLLSLICGVIYYYVTNYILANKLNLE